MKDKIVLCIPSEDNPKPIAADLEQQGKYIILKRITNLNAR